MIIDLIVISLFAGYKLYTHLKKQKVKFKCFKIDNTIILGTVHSADIKTFDKNLLKNILSCENLIVEGVNCFHIDTKNKEFKKHYLEDDREFFIKNVNVYPNYSLIPFFQKSVVSYETDEDLISLIHKKECIDEIFTLESYVKLLFLFNDKKIVYLDENEDLKSEYENKDLKSKYESKDLKSEYHNAVKKLENFTIKPKGMLSNTLRKIQKIISSVFFSIGNLEYHIIDSVIFEKITTFIYKYLFRMDIIESRNILWVEKIDITKSNIVLAGSHHVNDLISRLNYQKIQRWDYDLGEFI